MAAIIVLANQPDGVKTRCYNIRPSTKGIDVFRTRRDNLHQSRIRRCLGGINDPTSSEPLEGKKLAPCPIKIMGATVPKDTIIELQGGIVAEYTCSISERKMYKQLQGEDLEEWLRDDGSPVIQFPLKKISEYSGRSQNKHQRYTFELTDNADNRFIFRFAAPESDKEGDSAVKDDLVAIHDQWKDELMKCIPVGPTCAWTAWFKGEPLAMSKIPLDFKDGDDMEKKLSFVKAFQDLLRNGKVLDRTPCLKNLARPGVREQVEKSLLTFLDQCSEQMHALPAIKLLADIVDISDGILGQLETRNMGPSDIDYPRKSCEFIKHSIWLEKGLWRRLVESELEKIKIKFHEVLKNEKANAKLNGRTETKLETYLMQAACNYATQISDLKLICDATACEGAKTTELQKCVFETYLEDAPKVYLSDEDKQITESIMKRVQESIPKRLPKELSKPRSKLLETCRDILRKNLKELMEKFRM